MAIIEFPPIENADENGVLAFGGDVEVSSLKLAYSQGIFPWPLDDELPLVWFSPDPRGILFFKHFHLSKSFKKFLTNTSFYVRFNTNFESVILNCQRSDKRKEGTWITDEIVEGYIEFHKNGQAFSVETYQEVEGEETLVGGLYGVNHLNVVSGESMFYAKDNASKMALYALCERLHSYGLTWIDTQMVSPILKNLGAKEVKRSEFVTMLKLSHNTEREDIFSRLSGEEKWTYRGDFNSTLER